jgi:hypothetical protein
MDFSRHCIVLFFGNIFFRKNISSLDHKIFDNPMKFRGIIPVAFCQVYEILFMPGCVVKKYRIHIAMSGFYGDKIVFLGGAPCRNKGSGYNQE